MNNAIKKYLIYTFGFTWLLWGIVILGTKRWRWEYGNPMAMACYVLGVFGPVLGAIIVKKQMSTKEEFKVFVKGIVDVKHPLKHYLLSIIAPIGLAILPMFMGGAEMKQPFYMGFVLIIPMIVGGGLEEIGWRGFLLPELQKSYSPVVSTSIVAPVWAIWHIPLWFIAFTQQAHMSYAFFCILIVAFAFLLASVYQVTKSTYLCIVCHASINAFAQVFMANNKLMPIIPEAVLAVALLIILQNRRDNKSSSDREP